MRALEDIQYVVGNIGALTHLPGRIYKLGKLLFYQSTVPLLKDPFLLDKDRALCISGPLGYYQSEYGYYYGILHVEGHQIVLGPMKNPAVSMQGLRSMAFSLDLPVSSAEEFAAGMESLPRIDLMALLQILCLIDFSLTGKRTSLENIAIDEEQQGALQEELGKNQAERALDDTELETAQSLSALNIENRLMDMVMRGDLAALQGFLSSAPAVKGGTVAREQLRQMKNIFIVTTTLVSRAAIRGGMDVGAALGLSDAYIQKCELSDSPAQITELNYRLILDYAERVAQIRLGKDPSALVIKVSNYVQKHLSEPIKVEDIAKDLYMGRSRLSTNFKKETGMDLSSFITGLKINEAKRLLRYTDKTFAAISLYLGFSSQSHFTRVFKKTTDMTPMEYRQLHTHY